MILVRVSSSMLKAIAYHSGAKVLQANFRNGSIFQYFNVPEEVYQGLIASNSKGSFFRMKVMNCFYFQKIEDSVVEEI